MDLISGLKIIKHPREERLFAVEVFSENGLKASSAFYSPASVILKPESFNANAIEDVLKGSDVLEYENSLRKLKLIKNSLTSELYAALDNALFCISAEALGLPEYQLLGGKVRDKISFASYDTEEKPSILKLKLSGNAYFSRDALKHDIEKIEAARNRISDDTRLMLVFNEGIDNEYIIRAAKEFKRLSVRYIEIPLSSSSYITLRRFRDIMNPNGIMLLTAESSHTLFSARELISSHCTDLIRIDLSSCGISEAKKISSYAQMNGIMTIPVGMGKLTKHFALSGLTVPFIDAEATAEDIFFGKEIFNQ